MDTTLYHQTLKAMQDSGANKDYCYGWASGALGNPAREEQRATEAYTTGYEHGSTGVTDAWQSWVNQ